MHHSITPAYEADALDRERQSEASGPQPRNLKGATWRRSDDGTWTKVEDEKPEMKREAA